MTLSRYNVYSAHDTNILYKNKRNYDRSTCKMIKLRYFDASMQDIISEHVSRQLR